MSGNGLPILPTERQPVGRKQSACLDRNLVAPSVESMPSATPRSSFNGPITRWFKG